MIYTNIWESKQFSNLTDKEKLVYIGLITLADDEGRFKCDSLLLKSKLFPFSKKGHVTRPSDIKKGLKRMNDMGMVRIWQADGEWVGEHPKWKKYQKLREDRVKLSDISPHNDAESPPKLSKDKLSKDKVREWQPLTEKYKKRYPHLLLQEELEKFELYNRDVRTTPLKSVELAWINWLKKAEEFRLKSPEVIKEREIDAQLKKTEALKSITGKPMPKELLKKKDDLLKKVGI